MEHRHYRRIAAAILGCEGEHSVALLLDNEKEEAHGTPERWSPAEYHNKKAGVPTGFVYLNFIRVQFVDDNHCLI